MVFTAEQSAFFAAHHGVVSKSEALEKLQFSRGQVDRMLANGTLKRVHYGTYRLASSPETWRSKLRAAAISTNGLVSHGAAAALWNIDGFSPSLVEISIWESKRVEREGVIVHFSRQMHLAEPEIIDGIAVTGAARTVLDLFGTLGPKRRQQLLDAVLRSRLVSLEDLYEVVIRHSIQGRNGVGVLRNTLNFDYDPSTIPDSRWNRMVGQLLGDHDVYGVVYEHEVFDRSGRFVARLDLAIPELFIGIELDSVRWHMNHDSFVNDPRRRNRLQIEGWTILNFTWTDYAEAPDQLVKTVRRVVSNQSC